MKHKKRVVIVGGGFSGRTAYRLLQTQFDVTLFDSKDYFEYVPSVLRCLVQPDHILNILVNQPKHVTVATVVDFDAEKVTLTTGEVVPFDYCLVCAGTTYQSPIKPKQQAEDRRESRIAVLRDYASQIESAKQIAVIGGGTVGVELAAEIAGASNRKKGVLLISSSDQLLERMPGKAQEYAKSWLEDAGVVVMLGHRVQDISEKQITTDKESFYENDLIFECLGSHTISVRNQGNAQTMGVPEMKNLNAIKVNSHTLQVEGFVNVFACGDCTDTHEEKTAFAAEVSAQLAVKNIVQLSQNKELLTYPEGVCHGRQTLPEIACISLYKSDGILQVNQLVLTGRIPALVKFQIEFMQLALAKEKTWAIVSWHFMEMLNLWVSKFL